MPFEIKELQVQSTDNIHTLMGKIYIPEGEIKGLFHIIHGMTEHIDRYSGFMTYMAENGYVCFGYDNLGHGKTARDDSELGFFAHKDGWKYLVRDVLAFENAVKTIYPDKKLYLFGHSMGSFIARLAAESFGEIYEKVIFCGTAGKNPLAAAGLLLTNLLKLKGEKYISKTVQDMAFGSYNRRFEGISNYDWLTTDRQVIEKYSADKYCTFKFSVSAMHDLIKLIDLCNKKAWFKDIKKDLSILLIAGSEDPVGNYGKGIKEVYNKLIKNGSKAQMKLYEGFRHEIHNDYCSQEVMTDILNFIS